MVHIFEADEQGIQADTLAFSDVPVLARERILRDSEAVRRKKPSIFL